MRRMGLWIVVVITLTVLAGCAAGSNELVNSANAQGIVAGFWRGLWNGIIAPVTFVISLFNRNVQMYEVHNNGGWYNFGFLLGVIIIFGGGGSGARGASGRSSRR
jgi:uncharacterized spore protein YtfJ